MWWAARGGFSSVVDAGGGEAAVPIAQLVCQHTWDISG